MESTRMGGRYVLSIGLAVAVAATGCSRSRSSSRVAHRRIPSQAPIVSEGPINASEVPLSLPPSSRNYPIDPGSSYGLAPGSVVAPPGSAGSSRDIRYPQLNAERPRTASTFEPSRPTTPVRPTPMPTPKSANSEVGVNLPPAPTRNGNGSKQNTAAQSETASPTDEATGIPHYTVIEPNVATGGQPTYDGLKWLKERGFRAVLNLLPESEADPAEASIVREQGLEYLSMPITAETLSRAASDMFNQLADDVNYRPLFIHDSTGARSGALWYLHRVRVDRIPEERARSQAARVGLKDGDTDLWLAIQRVLSEDK